jgi:hypothetical protein
MRHSRRLTSAVRIPWENLCKPLVCLGLFRVLFRGLKMFIVSESCEIESLAFCCKGGCSLVGWRVDRVICDQ